jgi:hypothetical protein
MCRYPFLSQASRSLARTPFAVLLAHHHRRAGFQLVDAHGQVTDDVFVDRGLALQLGNDAGGGLDVQQHEVRLAVLLDLVCEVAQTPGLGLGDLAFVLFDNLGCGLGQRVHLGLGQVLARQKHMLVKRHVGFLYSSADR